MFSLEVENYFYEADLPDVHAIVNSYLELVERDKFQLKLITTNILTMLSERVYFNRKEVRLPLIDVKVSQFTARRKHTYIITCNNGTEYAIRIFCYSLMTEHDLNALDLFVRKYKRYKRIVITPQYSEIVQGCASEKDIEIFDMKTFSEKFGKPSNIVILNSPSQIAKLTNTNFYNTLIMLHSHPTAKYYGLRNGDIISISENNKIPRNYIVV